MFSLLAQTSGELITPNLHVILIHYPLGLLVAGLFIEMLAFMWRRSSVRTAARWMILIGALSMIPAATSGMYALQMASQHALEAGNPLTSIQRGLIVRHIWFNGGGALVAAIVVVTWLGATDRIRANFHLGFLALLLASVTLTVMGAWHGGEMVYAHGLEVSVKRSTVDPHTVTAPAAVVAATQAAGTAETTTRPIAEITVPASASENGQTVNLTDRRTDLLGVLEKQVPPMEGHSIFAGITVAIALAAMGLSIRRLGTESVMVEGNVEDMGEITSALESRHHDTMIADAINPRDHGMPEAIIEQQPIDGPPAARWWMLMVLLGILTAVGGLWTLASVSENYHLDQLWAMIREANRRMAHVVLGVSIIALPLVLAMLARFAPRRRMLFAIFALLLLGTIAFQIWMGILLMFDGETSGPLFRFVTPPSVNSPV